MTIAIGMLSDSGAVICADSLVSSGSLGSHESKIMAYRVDGADVVFALAGNVDLAESALQQCEPVILGHTGKKTSARQLANSLRPVLGKEYKEQVIDCGYVGTHYDYSFLVSIRVGTQVELYYTYSKTLKKSRRGREFIGAGGDLARMLFQWFDYTPLSAEKAGQTSAAVVGTLKRLMPGIVGGNNLILSLGSDGEILFYRDSDLRAIEQYAPAYDIEADLLHRSFIDGSITVEGFDKALDRFVQQVRFWHTQLKKELGGIVFSTPQLRPTRRSST